MSEVFRKPDGTLTENIEEYGKAWMDLGNEVAKLFPGYIATGFDPDITFEFREIGKISNTYKVSDSFRLSPKACRALLDKVPPKKAYREDF